MSERLASEASFASFCGVSPVEDSSSKTRRRGSTEAVTVKPNRLTLGPGHRGGSSNTTQGCCRGSGTRLPAVPPVRQLRQPRLRLGSERARLSAVGAGRFRVVLR
ncbi:hypothetical protein [Streptomyces sp. NPDC099088]|uniref:hypothetical protein n=1 Tax=Streptomyces sp. NPDC099088 TaxID=3366101 RepID=UPI003809E790